MYLKDFTNKGFIVTKEDEIKESDKRIYRRVMKDEFEHIEIMKWFTDDKDWNEVRDYAYDNYKCSLVCIHSGSDGSYPVLNKYAKGERIILEREGIQLFIEKDVDTDFIYQIDMNINYVNGGAGTENFYRAETSTDKTTVNYVLGLILKKKFELLEESDERLVEEIEKLQSRNKYYKENYSKGIGFLIDCVRI